MGNSDDSLKVSAAKWKTIEVIRDTLHEPYMLTMALQRKDYTLSDFYGDWLRTKMNLQKIHYSLAKDIVTNMNNREDRLMNNKLILAAVYLDPRYNMLLNETDREIAVSYLCELHCRLNETDLIDTGTNNTNTAETDDFQIFLQNATNRNEDTGIVNRISQFRNRPPINYKTNIFEYWRRMKIEEPDLFKLVMTLFTVAVTQVDVERAFSSLKFIFNNYRSNLNTPMLSKILILRSNADLFPKSTDLYLDELSLEHANQ